MRLSRVTLALLTLAPSSPASEPYVHDGFYASFAAGPSWIDYERTTSQDGAPGTLSYTGAGSSVSGVALSSGVSVGGTPFPGVVFAGTLHTEMLPAPRLVTADGRTHALSGPLIFTLLAPTVDIYSDARAGLHYGLGAGLAAVTARFDDPPFHSLSGIGPGFTLSLGYDFWTAPEWSVGFAGRGVFAAVTREQHAEGITGHERGSVASASLLVTLAYH